MLELIRAHISRSIATKEALLAGDLSQVAKAGNLIATAMQNGHKLLLAGNGGSAGDAQHIATEFTIRYKAQNVRPGLPALALTTDTSALTACGNDFGFERIFARQLEALGQKGDVFLMISTSGDSANLLQAIPVALEKGVEMILLSGQTGGRIRAEYADKLSACILVPSQETARIQECHIMVGQILCAIVEKILFNFD